MRQFLFLLALLAASVAGQAQDDPLAPWKHGVKIQPVSPLEGRHTIHTYYVACPESPDGSRVVFFCSTEPTGYVGELRVLERASGKETVVAADVHTEDAHRAACQQWLSGGRRVAYHEVRDGRWQVVSFDLETGRPTVVALDRQVGFGQPQGDLLPLYGCHWNPGPHRDLEIWNAASGQITRPVTTADVEAKYGPWLASEFKGKPTSIFFPILSPDLGRVFFKLAAGSGGDNFMAGNASHREGLVCYDLAASKFTWQSSRWGHPSWHPDSRQIFNMGNILTDSDTGRTTRIAGLPKPGGSHPSISPDGKLMVTDGEVGLLGGKEKQWGIVVGDLGSGNWVLLDSFDQSRGAKSWRRNNPHPVFSADGRRIYYNVSDGPFTRLLVAEAAGE
ncbi:MAG: hypothetical protein ACYC6Y_12950 [Thermoguttaceae bacterium]